MQGMHADHGRDFSAFICMQSEVASNAQGLHREVTLKTDIVMIHVDKIACGDAKIA